MGQHISVTVDWFCIASGKDIRLVGSRYRASRFRANDAVVRACSTVTRPARSRLEQISHNAFTISFQATPRQLLRHGRADEMGFVCVLISVSEQNYLSYRLTAKHGSHTPSSHGIKHVPLVFQVVSSPAAASSRSSGRAGP